MKTGEDFIKLRKSLGLSQDEASKLVGYTVRGIQKLEKCPDKPLRPRMLKKLHKLKRK